VRPHDLLRVSAIAPTQPPATWVGRSLARAPWVVVRRAPAAHGMIPVGVRGTARNQRFACHVDAACVLERLTPSQLLPRIDDLAPDAPVRRAFGALERILEQQLGSPAWGPGGSVAFELATGLGTIHADSDLDVVLQRDERLSGPAARALIAAFARLPCRIDCLLSTPRGGLSLADWARPAADVLVKTADGPVLTRDPWSTP
jgi:phosphoribosyl-dephospho-CoA transferase